MRGRLRGLGPLQLHWTTWRPGSRLERSLRPGPNLWSVRPPPTPTGPSILGRVQPLPPWLRGHSPVALQCRGSWLETLASTRVCWAPSTVLSAAPPRVQIPQIPMTNQSRMKMTQHKVWFRSCCTGTAAPLLLDVPADQQLKRAPLMSVGPTHNSVSWPGLRSNYP